MSKYILSVDRIRSKPVYLELHEELIFTFRLEGILFIYQYKPIVKKGMRSMMNELNIYFSRLF